jgi:hypothetical protein
MPSPGSNHPLDETAAGHTLPSIPCPQLICGTWYSRIPAGETEGLTSMTLNPWTIILGLFLMHLAEFVGAFVLIEWLVRWSGSATTTEAALMFGAASVAMATVAVLVARGRLGVIIAVAVMVFWSLVIFGARGAVAINILALAGAILVVAATLVLIESFLARQGAT